MTQKYSVNRQLNLSNKCYGGHHQGQLFGCRGKNGTCECDCHHG